MTMEDQFPYPVARIGLIGGGQLGRMMVKAAKRLGCTCVVLDPVPGSPAEQIAVQIVGDYSDPAMLRELAEACDVLTFELEDIETETLARLEQEGHRIYPRPELLAIIQDKYRQKQFLRDAGIPTSEFIDMPEPDAEAFAAFGYPLVQKARRGGYDGRGVAVMKDAQAFASHLPVPGYVERFVEAEKELAVIVARDAAGECRAYPAVEMRFHAQGNVLDFLVAPAQVAPDIALRAEQLAMRTVEAMQGVGVFGIELFLTAADELLVNEVAPRTHNSGHHTIEVCVTDQFEQHLRAILGLPLGETRQLSPATMVNLLGEPGYQGRPVIAGLAAVLAIPGVCVHVYGKAVTKPGRKMGHVTVIDESIAGSCDKARQVKKMIRILGEEKL